MNPTTSTPETVSRAITSEGTELLETINHYAGDEIADALLAPDEEVASRLGRLAALTLQPEVHEE